MTPCKFHLEKMNTGKGSLRVKLSSKELDAEWDKDFCVSEGKYRIIFAG